MQEFENVAELLDIRTVSLLSCRWLDTACETLQALNLATDFEFENVIARDKGEESMYSNAIEQSLLRCSIPLVLNGAKDAFEMLMTSEAGRGSYDLVMKVTPLADGMAVFVDPYNLAGRCLYSFFSNFDLVLAHVWDFQDGRLAREPIGEEEFRSLVVNLFERVVRVMALFSGNGVESEAQKVWGMVSEIRSLVGGRPQSPTGEPLHRDIVVRVTSQNRFLRFT